MRTDVFCTIYFVQIVSINVELILSKEIRNGEQLIIFKNVLHMWNVEIFVFMKQNKLRKVNMNSGLCSLNQEFLKYSDEFTEIHALKSKPSSL